MTIDAGRIAMVIATAAVAAVANYFGLTAPAAKQADLDRDANFSCRDQLAQTRSERDEWIERYLTEHP